MEAIVLAGGMGERLRQVVSDVPKPMAPIGGRPFLEYLLDHWEAQGVRRFILCVGYKKDLITNHFGNQYRKAEVRYSIEDTPLGTGGALLKACRNFDLEDSFLTLNGDTFFSVVLSDLKQAHESKDADVSLALAKVLDGKRYERVELDRENRVLAFKSRDSESSSPWVSGGVYWLNRRALKDFDNGRDTQVSFEREWIPWMLGKRMKIYGFPSGGRFVDIGTPESYRLAAVLLERKARVSL